MLGGGGQHWSIPYSCWAYFSEHRIVILKRKQCSVNVSCFWLVLSYNLLRAFPWLPMLHFWGIGPNLNNFLPYIFHSSVLFTVVALYPDLRPTQYKQHHFWNLLFVRYIREKCWLLTLYTTHLWIFNFVLSKVSVLCNYCEKTDDIYKNIINIQSRPKTSKM